MVQGQGRTPITFQPSQRPILIVVVDTEEEFDWNAELSRDATSVAAMSEICRFQRVSDEFEICPTYVVTYPVATQAEGVEFLKEFHRSGRAVIGTHLHPWVSPPFDEALNTYNSYPGNLDPRTESAKLRVLSDATAAAFGMRPAIYKAGRYGVGPHTAAILSEQGYEIDLSPAPPMDYRADGGPDFSSYPVEPYWFGDGDRLLGIPSTGAYVGFVGYGAHSIYNWSTRGLLGWCRFSGLLARSGMIDRLRLSPEGFTLDENRKLTTALLRSGKRVFQFTLHSPSMMPNGTPYVRSELDRDRLLDLCRHYFEWFLETLDGVTMTPGDLRSHIMSLHSS